MILVTLRDCLYSSVGPNCNVERTSEGRDVASSILAEGILPCHDESFYGDPRVILLPTVCASRNFFERTSGETFGLRR